jgi:hypothetical protein
MGKIIEFRLPERTAGGHAGFEIPVGGNPIRPKGPQRSRLLSPLCPTRRSL